MKAKAPVIVIPPYSREVAKQRARDEDERAIREGWKSPEQVRQDNGAFAFAQFDVSVDWDGAIRS